MIKNDASAMTASSQVYTDLNGVQNLKALARHDKDAALKEIAHQFESVMVQMMMKSMRQANAVFSEGDPLNSNEMQMYQDMFDNQLSVSLTQGKGMGIATALLRQLQGRAGVATHADAEKTVVSSSERAANSLDFPRSSLRGIDQRRAQDGADAALVPGSADNTYEQLLSLMSAADTGVATLPRQRAGDDTYNQMLTLMSAPEDSAARIDAGSLDGSPEQFVEALMPVAEQISAQLGVDSRVLLSQAALETGWGEKVMRRADGSSSFNFFNIKADAGWHGSVVTVPTIEYRNGIAVRESASFRAYASPQESFADYAKLIGENPRYQKALAQAADPHAYVHALQRAGYATDPQYAQKVLSVLASNSLQHAALANDVNDTALR